MGKREDVCQIGWDLKEELTYDKNHRTLEDIETRKSGDCSSFFRYCLVKGAGVDPGTYTGTQIDNGRDISKAELQPGDGVFYMKEDTGKDSHVELYVGPGEKTLSHGGPGKGPVERNGFRAGARFKSYIDDASSETGDGYYFTAPILQKGSTGVGVLLLQEILKARGIYTGELDQNFGDQTDAALRTYQEFRGLAVDGSCGDATWGDMLALDTVGTRRYFAHTCLPGDMNTSVLLVQEILKARNYYTGDLDQSYGSQTQEAVRKYQSDRAGAAGPVDGYCGKATWSDLIAL